MTRSPLSYPLNRGMDLDAGGAADLQTDVMRFMAILSLCLVAIFALVQSLPINPETNPSMPRSPMTNAPPKPEQTPPAEPTARRQEKPRPPAAAREIVPERLSAAEPRLERLPPAPVYLPVSTPDPVPSESIPLASPAAPVPAAAPAPAAQDPADEGFTLRFESDLALKRLVSRNEIGLYAIQADRSLRMNVNRGAMSFWPASSPAQFHEMDHATVPTDVVAASRRAGASGAVQWGVTLPNRLSRELNRYLSSATGGALIIDGDGAMRLEQ